MRKLSSFAIAIALVVGIATQAVAKVPASTAAVPQPRAVTAQPRQQETLPTPVPGGKTAVILSPDITAALDTEAPGMLVLESMAAITNLMEPLVDWTYDGTKSPGGVLVPDYSKPEGRLAESWTFDEATNTYTFNLRHNVTSCAGNTFTADDVLYTFARAKSVSGALGPLGWFMLNMAGVKNFTPDVLGPEGDKTLGAEVTKVDDYTVQIQVNDKRRLFFPALTDFFTFIWDSKEMKAHATADDPWSHAWATDNNAPSFGPYCLSSWTKGQQLVAVANPNYYRGKPDIDTIIMQKVPEDANRIAALQAGQAQIVQSLTPKEYDFLRNAGNGVKVDSVVGNQFLFLGLSWNIPPFDNEKLRQAIAYAIPYDDILQTGYFGQAQKWDGTVPSSYEGFLKTSTQYDTDLTKAAQLLSDAGFPNGQGLDPNLFQINYTAEREATLGPIATLIQANLQKIGINAALNPEPQAQFADDVFAKHNKGIFLDDQDKPDLPSGEYAVTPFMTTTGPGNYTKYSNPEVDALVAKMLDEDDASAQADLNKIQEILMAAPNWIPIAEYPTQWGTSDSISGTSFHPDDQLRWFDLKMADQP